MSEAGVLLKEDSLIDATIIEAPSSTKNRSGERDRNGGPPEMHQTIYGRPWFAMAYNRFWFGEVESCSHISGLSLRPSPLSLMECADRGTIKKSHSRVPSLVRVHPVTV
ncbi:hypothetical protein GCM10011348_03480 [Marinobacterium nitratireducens]|uniref:Uncharacterized protein n=1 Tax=Marinobacterium nitratireducens TaxID=518897 RepID=A0A917Z7S4_9GAMM|nr:hypothetical protein GCM10011348_03480 [Marinobacterium nitratireducens]